MSGEPAAGMVADVLATAHVDQSSVLELATELVRIPSRGGVDAYDPVLSRMQAWLDARGLTSRRVSGETGPVALVAEISGGRPGPRWVLDACLDTAGFGDVDAWTRAPTSGVISGGWLHGRGAADSKLGASIFAHIAARLAAVRDQWAGTLVLLYDVDEHTGGFGGAKSYFAGPEAPNDVAGVMIGYPGLDHLVTGGRGVLRLRLHVHGAAAHSGGSTVRGANAIAKAAALIHALETADLPGVTLGFPPPRLTVTAIEGGQGFSVVPDLCAVNVDVRLTPALDDQAASELMTGLVAEVDAVWKGTPPTHIEVVTRWPHYRLGEDSVMVGALLGPVRSLDQGLLVTIG